LITAPRKDRGFTIVEAMVAMVVMSLGLLAAVAVLRRGTAFSESSSALLRSQDRARGALAGIFDPLTEASIDNVDTSMRVHNTLAVINDVSSDRFTIPGVSLRQCTSPTCRFHTRTDLSVITRNRNCSFEYCTGALNASVTRGKIVPGTLTSCPYDGSSLSTTARLDGVRFFVARDQTWAFTALANGSPKWSGLVLMFPCVSSNGLTELKRFDVYASDLVAAPPSYSTGFNRFTPLAPSMIDLFDFGTDGTINGVCDAKVPLTNATSDAKSEMFTTATYNGSPVILITKSLGGGIVYPARSLTLRIDLASGQTYFSVSHYDTATVYWTATRTFTRMPRTLVRNVTEFAVSTAVSDPYDAVSNPRGVSEPDVIRVTLGTSDAGHTEGSEWQHHVEEFQLKARNN
jgi:prepilin-type N-terminal cleavage/methylation domain-containing protein